MSKRETKKLHSFPDSESVMFMDGAEAMRLAETILAEAQREPDLLVTVGGKTKRYVYSHSNSAGKVYLEAPSPVICDHCGQVIPPHV